MARNELNKGNGILFYEQDVKSDKAPDMTGRIHVNCPECGRSTMQRLAGWWHRKGDNKYLKVSHSDFPPKSSRGDDHARGGRSRRDYDDDDDRRSRRGGNRDRRDDDRRSDRDDDRRPPPRDEDYREPEDRGDW